MLQDPHPQGRQFVAEVRQHPAVVQQVDMGHGLVDAAEAAGTPALPPNDPPSVTITSLADGSTFDSGATILFEGMASDTEDGDLTASLAWTSSIDGPIGSGGSFSNTLSDGTHTIAASVTDSGGATGSAGRARRASPPRPAACGRGGSLAQRGPAPGDNSGWRRF